MSIGILGHSMDWSAVRSTYEAKKRKNCESEAAWGESYGYELMAPYSVEEVETLERNAGVPVPTGLREYLLNVSKEVFVTKYPTVFCFGGVYGSCRVPLDVTMWMDSDVPEDSDFPEDEDVTSGMALLGDCGCADSVLIVVRGNGIGSVWDSDSDRVYYRAASFIDYLVYDMHRRC